MFDCGVTVQQNMANSNKIFWFCHWISASSNSHTIAMAKKVNCNENKLRICIFNDCDNSGSEYLKLIRNRWAFRINYRVHYIVSSRSVQVCMNATMDAELAVLSVSTNSWNWIEGLALAAKQGLQYTIYTILLCGLMFMYKHKH